MKISASFVLACIAIALSGCGRWNIDRLDEDTSVAIDGQLSVGLSERRVLEIFPDAVLIDDTGEQKRYLVYDRQTCFWCSSPQGFVRSHDILARVVVLEDGRLAAIHPVTESR